MRDGFPVTTGCAAFHEQAVVFSLIVHKRRLRSPRKTTKEEQQRAHVLIAVEAGSRIFGGELEGGGGGGGRLRSGRTACPCFDR